MSQSTEMLFILEYIKYNKMKRKWFWLSIRKAKNCLFSRRYGHVGIIIHGYSVCLRLFNIDLL
jgi:hypothetical protein